MDTFTVTYHITVQSGESIDRKVEKICLEQSAELPREALTNQQAEKIPGTPLKKSHIGDKRYEVAIRWPTSHIGEEITQFLNLLYGNISLKPGIRISNVEWDHLPPFLLPGPALGVRELRRRYDISSRPLSCSAIKPLSLSAEECGERVYSMGCGGIDIIKDDHGLANQKYAPFEERVRQCVDAARQAERDTGHYPRYFPNITTDAGLVIDRYQKAAEGGADGVLLSPHITGLSTLATLARSDIELPIIAHPAFSGTLTSNPDHGMTPSFLYGQLWRMFGADFVIFPDARGRFSFTRRDCKEISNAATDQSLSCDASFPMVGGGLSLENLSDYFEIYGSDVTYLIGSSLYQHPEGLRYASNEFSEMLRGNL